MTDIVLVDSATSLKEQAKGAVVVAGSQASVLPANLVARAGARAAVLHDAGIGKDDAGVAGLAYGDGLGLALCAVDYRSARISDAKDMMARGTVSRVSRLAAALGCAPGMAAKDAAELLRAADVPHTVPPPYDESKSRALVLQSPRGLEVWALDSNSHLRDDDAGHVVLTGSHGGLVGGKPESALRVKARAAVFNDAGICPDGSSTSRLPVLDEWGIAAALVSAASARISDGRSTYEDGVLSMVNARAKALGARPGMSARDFVDLIVRAHDATA
jgi:uncharacterized protein YunC (DUF1805 family)